MYYFSKNNIDRGLCQYIKTFLVFFIFIILILLPKNTFAAENPLETFFDSMKRSQEGLGQSLDDLKETFEKNKQEKQQELEEKVKTEVSLSFEKAKQRLIQELKIKLQQGIDLLRQGTGKFFKSFFVFLLDFIRNIFGKIYSLIMENIR